MKLIKSISALLLEQDDLTPEQRAELSKNLAIANNKPVASNQANSQGSTQASSKNTSQQKTDKVVEQPKPVSTAPDAAVMSKLLKMPNSRGALLYNSNEEKPTSNNGVSVVVKGTGRNYYFRSSPTNVVVYINDDSGNQAYAGTYTMTDTEIITKSTDGKITETITLSDARIAVDPKTKALKSNLPSNETADQKQKSVELTIASAINANAGAWTDSNEEVVYNAVEAAIYWITKNNLSADKAKEFLKIAFSKADITITSMELDSWAGIFAYLETGPASKIIKRLLDWNIVWRPEDDEDNKYLASKVPSKNSIGSYEPIGDDAKKWAQAIWNIIDDNWVSIDEEINVILAVLALSPKGLLNVEAAWKDLQNLGIIDSTLGIAAAIADEVDSEDAGILVQRFAAALSENPSEGAKKMLEFS